MSTPRNHDAPSLWSCWGKTKVPRDITEPEITSPFKPFQKGVMPVSVPMYRPAATCHNHSDDWACSSWTTAWPPSTREASNPIPQPCETGLWAHAEVPPARRSPATQRRRCVMVFMLSQCKQNVTQKQHRPFTLFTFKRLQPPLWGNTKPQSCTSKRLSPFM